jgi:hypothetical protein
MRVLKDPSRTVTWDFLRGWPLFLSVGLVRWMTMMSHSRTIRSGLNHPVFETLGVLFCFIGMLTTTSSAGC